MCCPICQRPFSRKSADQLPHGNGVQKRFRICAESFGGLSHHGREWAGSSRPCAQSVWPPPIPFLTCRKNIKAYTQTIDGFQVRVISSRQQEVSRPVFLIPNTPLHTCLETSEVPLGKGESMTVTPDWEGVLRECGQKANQIITRFDQLKSIPYPFILDSFSSSSSK